MVSASDAAVCIQAWQRGRRVRQRYLLQQLAFLVQSHYRDPNAFIIPPEADATVLTGAVRRLEGRLWKKSSQIPKFQERNVWVDDLQVAASLPCTRMHVWCLHTGNISARCARS